MQEHIITRSSDDAPSRAIAASDAQLGSVIDRIGALERGPIGSGFPVIARSIVGQQLSEKVAPVIWSRVVSTVGETAEAIASAPHEALRAAGLSGRKAEYLQGIAHETLEGSLDWDSLAADDDEIVIEKLTRLRGVGRWTAEMYLIFALERPDVLALDDLGVRVSAGKMAGLGRQMTRGELDQRGERWAPYRSTASLWLWADHG